MKTDSNSVLDGTQDILFSRTVKAGSRIYYIDVKRNRMDELYLCITESKRQKSTDGDFPAVSFEKHKIFLFPEDFGKFTESLKEATDYLEQMQGKAEPRREFPKEIHFDIDF